MMSDLLSRHDQPSGGAVRAIPQDRADRFSSLIATALDDAYRMATVILAGDRLEAEDAVHDAGLRAWQHFDELRDPERFAAWFTRIVVNSCRDRMKRRRLRAISAEMTPGQGYGQPEAVIAADTLERALLDLTPEHRVVVALRYLADLSIDEIAGRTGERTGTVKSRLHYALRSLRAALDADAREGMA